MLFFTSGKFFGIVFCLQPFLPEFPEQFREELQLIPRRRHLSCQQYGGVKGTHITVPDGGKYAGFFRFACRSGEEHRRFRQGQTVTAFKIVTCQEQIYLAAVAPQSHILKAPGDKVGTVKVRRGQKF